MNVSSVTEKLVRAQQELREAEQAFREAGMSVTLVTGMEHWELGRVEEVFERVMSELSFLADTIRQMGLREPEEVTPAPVAIGLHYGMVRK